MNGLRKVFDQEYTALSRQEAMVLDADFEDFLREDYDSPFDEYEAAREFARRIGRGNLYSYCACLLAQEGGR